MKMEDVIAAFFIHKDAKEMIDENGVTLALIRMNKSGLVSINWESGLFLPESGRAMPDVLRAELVRKLRQYADGLESREVDKLIREFSSKTGTT